MAFTPLTQEQFKKAQAAGFSTDQIIQFEQKRKSSTSSAGPITGPTWDGGILGSIAKAPTQFGVGAGTAIGKTLFNVAKAGANLVGATGWAKNIDKASTAMFDQPSMQSQRANMPGAVGTVVGKIAPYVAAAGPISAGTNVASGLAAEVPGVTGAIYRTLLGATAEGAQNYILGYALSGGDTNAAKTQAVTAGLLKGVTAGAGEALKGGGVDVGLMGKIYPANKAETGRMLFGTQEKSMAQQAVERGLSGNVTQQAVQIQKGLSSSEQALEKEFEQAGNPLIQLSNPQRYIDAIQKRITMLESAGATEEAQGLKSSLANIGPDGKITANAALGLRRFMDGLRQSKSFLTPTEELQVQQAGLKEMSDSLRGKINSIGENSSIMKDYQFYTTAKEQLINYAKKSANKQTIDFFDKLLLAESVFAHTPVGLGIVAGRTAAGAAPASTAQFVRNLPTSGQFGTAVRSIGGGALGGLGSQGSQSPGQ